MNSESLESGDDDGYALAIAEDAFYRRRDKSMAVECSDCGKYLTATEEHYYGHRCEWCEGKWFERIEAWRRGGDDEELDECFAVP